ncbi:MAG: hypothetical protein EBY38_06265 [Flavobacteriaceae bacterium]|nr:hypothetical protein [Flavobacteriaceae bacterium]
MPRAMYRYTKAVLKKVSFDLQLFAAELRKAKLRLLPNELEELRIWLISWVKRHPQLMPCLSGF